MHNFDISPLQQLKQK